MDHHRDYDSYYDHHSSWSYDSYGPPPPYHDGGYGGGGGHYNNHHRDRYQNNHYQDGYNSNNNNEPYDSFGYSNGPPFKRPFSQTGHAPSNEYFDSSGCVKLYVSCVPREVTQEEIRSIFGKHGEIIEVILFKNLRNLQTREGCFVKFANIEEAEQAIQALHNQYIFPGGIRPIEVRHASKADIADLFSPYGYVEDVFIICDEHKQSRGSGFITFTDRAMAAAAINALDGNFVMDGCDHPLVVRFAAPRKPKFAENRFAPPYSDPVGQTSYMSSQTGSRAPVGPPYSDPMGQTSHMSSQTGSRAPSVSSNCSDMEDMPECDWSEQICPDGNAYYYNCVTLESRWEKPEEYSYYEQQLEHCNYQSNSPWQHA